MTKGGILMDIYVYKLKDYVFQKQNTIKDLRKIHDIV